MKKYIKLIRKAILKEIDKNRTIKNLDISFSIDGADNPIIKVKLENKINELDYKQAELTKKIAELNGIGG